MPTFQREIINVLLEDRRVLCVVIFPILLFLSTLFGSFVVFGSLFFTTIFYTLVIYKSEYEDFNKRYNLTLRNYKENFKLPKDHPNNNNEEIINNGIIKELEGAGDSGVFNIMLQFMWEKWATGTLENILTSINNNFSQQLQVEGEGMLIESLQITKVSGGFASPRLLFVQSKRNSSSSSSPSPSSSSPSLIVIDGGCEFYSDLVFKLNLKVSSVSFSFLLSNIKFIGIVRFLFILQLLLLLLLLLLFIHYYYYSYYYYYYYYYYLSFVRRRI